MGDGMRTGMRHRDEDEDRDNGGVRDGVRDVDEYLSKIKFKNWIQRG